MVLKVVALSAREERVPPRSSNLVGDARLIDIFAEDNQIVGLLQHLYAVHDIVTISELDAAGWNVINTFPGKFTAKKRRKLFETIGRPEAPKPMLPVDGARILTFVRPESARLGR